MNIKGTTRLAGVIGNPITHTLSPAMHNAAYEALELDWVYLPFEIADEVGLRRFVAAVPSLSVVGLNVTMPHKQAMLELCDEVAMAAQMAGAVNTVHCVDGRLIGYNTDGRGLLEALKAEAGFDVAGKDAVLLGAGGAAGAAFVALILGRAASITVVSRNAQSAGDLVERMSGHVGQVAASALAFEEAGAAIAAAHVIINATPIGMRTGDPAPIAAGLVGPGQLVYDMVYGTVETTALVRESRAAGAIALDGLGMLVGQAALAIDIWNTSVQSTAPRDVMRSAALAQLEARRAAV